ncbi:MAG: hypothetical protein SFX73_36260 [Kofleriaceae bacterium]|nr:hypothetical protein [Kofleriaceae bacterium]
MSANTRLALSARTVGARDDDVVPGRLGLASAAVRVRKTPPLPFPRVAAETTPESVVDLTSELEDE